MLSRRPTGRSAGRLGWAICRDGGMPIQSYGHGPRRNRYSQSKMVI